MSGKTSIDRAPFLGAGFWLGVVLALASLGTPTPLAAQASMRDEIGLPGGHRVGWLDDRGPDLAVVGRAGYGFIGEADGEGGSHTRLMGGQNY